MLKTKQQLGKLLQSKLKSVLNKDNNIHVYLHEIPNQFIGYYNTPSQAFHVYVVFPELFEKDKCEWNVDDKFKLFLELLSQSINDLSKINISSINEMKANQMISLLCWKTYMN